MIQKRHKGGVLVLAELKDGQLHPVTYELLYKGRELTDQMNRIRRASKAEHQEQCSNFVSESEICEERPDFISESEACKERPDFISESGTCKERPDFISESESCKERPDFVSESEACKERPDFISESEACEKCPDKALLTCLISGPDGVNAEEAAWRGADRVYYMKDPSLAVPDEMHFQKNIQAFLEEYQPDIILIGATHFGRSLAPRLAAGLHTGLTADCTDLRLDDTGRLVQIRPAFSDHILAHITTVNDPQMATIRYQEFKEAERMKNCEDTNAAVTEIPLYEKRERTCLITELPLREAFDITDADVVVAGGRGIRKKEDLVLLEELASLLGGVVGASRALVEAGLISAAHQVGYSGNRVKPQVYIACGISGAPQHLAGMKEAKTVIAINSDPSAPIFQVADLGYAGDLYDIIPRLTRELAQMGVGKQLEEKGEEQEISG